MNHLISVRENTLYNKKKKENPTDKDEYVKYHEIVLLVDKPKYKKTNDDQVVRERGVEEMRFLVGEEALDGLIKILESIKNGEVEYDGE